MGTNSITTSTDVGKRLEQPFYSFYGAAFSPQAFDNKGIESHIDPIELKIALDLFRAPDRCLVAGGGLGFVSMRLSAHLPAGVVTYEANPYLVDAMVRNVRFPGNRIPDVYNIALTTNNDPVQFHVHRSWHSSSLRQHRFFQDGDLVQTLTVPGRHINDALVRGRCNVLMLDVEGAEFDILPQLNPDLVRALSVEIHGTREENNALKATLRSMRYEIVHEIAYDETSQVEQIGCVRIDN